MPQGERIVYAVALIAALGFAGAAAVEFAKDRAAAIPPLAGDDVCNVSRSTLVHADTQSPRSTVILHQLFFRCGFDLGNRGFGWKFVH